MNETKTEQCQKCQKYDGVWRVEWSGQLCQKWQIGQVERAYKCDRHKQSECGKTNGEKSLFGAPAPTPTGAKTSFWPTLLSREKQGYQKYDLDFSVNKELQ